ncbi:histone-like nucleoid-structuring protein Lsr2 [Corynebacterium mastitidis]|uniref:histone-like nucleoid-structuring protein Lsr2 n=1 Tax=Corynebacterium mastitidis TaxID=161890 RepID=UPI00254CCA89|nr:Lsr2 family protein [Corynebacterium mastitidis]MDK8451458.1 Lsr2 family protein [Corynebacterium mastitidis]
MARKETVQYFDDLNGTPLGEDDVQVVYFSLGEKSYVMDLSAENAEKFQDVLRPYLDVARPHVPMAKKRRSNGATRKSKAREIRQWALDNGKDIALRGQIPSEIVEAYNEAHSANE